MLAISGWSGAGKTTVIEALIPRLSRRGLRVGVLKHDAHHLEFDRPGKDTMRVREAGAARVEAFDESWWFQVAPRPPGSGWAPLPRAWRQDVDILLVEGGKSGSMDKIWIVGPDGKGPPAGTRAVILTVQRGPDAVEAVETRLHSWLQSRWCERTRAAVVLAGAASCEPAAGVAGAFASTVLVAGRPVPGEARLPCIPGVEGPVGGMLAAMRWAPAFSWIVLHSGLLRLRVELLEWLWSKRRPGIWAVVPAVGGQPDPFAAVYEPQAVHVLEEAAPRGARGLSQVLSSHPCMSIVEPPDDLVDALAASGGQER
ncbi:MAG: molybdopterin-guanine dinucleotide biosynthesis protein B [Deltaproteobacteria bacterium]|nr:molybdopterin-guanine dinucleotide biosynthesis protein B [Deltaproteobacteria bacterium]